MNKNSGYARTTQVENLGLESQVEVKGMAFNKLGTVASTESRFGS